MVCRLWICPLLVAQVWLSVRRLIFRAFWKHYWPTAGEALIMISLAKPKTGMVHLSLSRMWAKKTVQSTLWIQRNFKYGIPLWTRCNSCIVRVLFVTLACRINFLFLKEYEMKRTALVLSLLFICSCNGSDSTTTSNNSGLSTPTKVSLVPAN